MLTVGDVLAKTLAKYQKITFWSKKITLDAFFFTNCWRCSYRRLMKLTFINRQLSTLIRKSIHSPAPFPINMG